MEAKHVVRIVPTSCKQGMEVERTIEQEVLSPSQRIVSVHSHYPEMQGGRDSWLVLVLEVPFEED
jgi:hypothetical protein